MPSWALVAVAGALVVLLVLAVSVAAVGRPASATVEHADAVAVHANAGRRLDKAIGLVEAGTAPVLVVSDAGGTYGRPASEFADLCSRREPYEVVCTQPEPLTTIGEARAFGRLAAERGWTRLVVVTDRWHLARASLAVAQCTEATVLPVAVRPRARPSLTQAPGELLRLAATRTVMHAC